MSTELGEPEEMRIGGTTIQYYFTCRREVWLYLNHIDPPQDDDNMTIGRLINERSLRKRGKKEVVLGSSKIDVVQTSKGLKIIEIKKSSKLLTPSIRQLQYYMYLMRKQGLHATGEISVPREKKRIPVELREQDVKVIEEAVEDIHRIASLEHMPEYHKKPYCKGCAYREFCEV